MMYKFVKITILLLLSILIISPIKAYVFLEHVNDFSGFHIKYSYGDFIIVQNWIGDGSYLRINIKNRFVSPCPLTVYMNSSIYTQKYYQLNEKLIFFDKSETTCYDIVSGNKHWGINSLNNVVNCFVKDSDLIVFTQNTESATVKIYSLNIFDGKIETIISYSSNEIGYNLYNLINLTDNYVLLYSFNGVYYCYKSDFSKILWQSKAFFEPGNPHDYSKIIDNKLVTVKTLDECNFSYYISCIDLNNGNETWCFKAHPNFKIINDYLYCYQFDKTCTKDINTYICKVSIKTGQIINKYKLHQYAYNVNMIVYYDDLCLLYIDKQNNELIFVLLNLDLFQIYSCNIHDLINKNEIFVNQSQDKLLIEISSESIHSIDILCYKLNNDISNYLYKYILYLCKYLYTSIIK